MKKAIFFRSEYDLSLHGLFNSFNNYVDDVDGSVSSFTDNDSSLPPKVLKNLKRRVIKSVRFVIRNSRIKVLRIYT